MFEYVLLSSISFGPFTPADLPATNPVSDIQQPTRQSRPFTPDDERSRKLEALQRENAATRARQEAAWRDAQVKAQRQQHVRSLNRSLTTIIGGVKRRI